MKVYLNESVFDAALNRMRWLFDEFPNVVVSMSGGKDSTVVYELARIVAREKNRLPLKVFWLDQECEFEATVVYQRQVMYDPDVEPLWFQIPFRLQNATSSTSLWLDAWGEGVEWVREKDPIAKHENTYKVDRFVKLMEAIIQQDYSGTPTAVLTGVRAEESPVRLMATTNSVTYKGASWGNTISKKNDHYSFHPIYDWSYIDIWKAIHDHNWTYNTHYDAMYRYGVPAMKMRVSNYHHETAVHALFMLQEIEPETYQAATRRISGIDTAAKLGKDDYFVYELPFMFTSWKEYRDYLLENLITEAKYRERFAVRFESIERRYPHAIDTSLYKTEINAILCNDIEMTKLSNWEAMNFTTKRLAERDGYNEKIS